MKLLHDTHCENRKLEWFLQVMPYYEDENLYKIYYCPKCKNYVKVVFDEDEGSVEQGKLFGGF